MAKNETPKGFASFWQAWPKHFRKQGKGYCLKIWKRKKLEAQADHIVAVVEAMRKSEQWLESRGHYIPLPSTWLNGERYDCELADIVPVTRSAPAKLTKQSYWATLTRQQKEAFCDRTAGKVPEAIDLAFAERTADA